MDLVAIVAAAYRIAKVDAAPDERFQQLEAGLQRAFQEQEASPQSITNIMWALARLRRGNTPVLEAVSLSAARRATELRSQDLSSIAWSLATLR
mmetsp:Transcript_76492/g.183253  ORF Transcript_76492/g.183253 Transcript_76492/m.183253 type:complete len:94 (+) Transcript_76492:29-310(+)